jgi:hypothetical protein
VAEGREHEGQPVEQLFPPSLAGLLPGGG